MPKKPYRPAKRTDRNSVGKTVSRLREKLNITQEELAGRAAGIGWTISRDVVKRIERGEREVTDIELRLLSAALRIPAAVLLD
jgi:transcriptional regulator with XRE-family HTH domain